jgi:seryl-tRNA synthetase
MIDRKYALANREIVRWATVVKGYDPNPFYDIDHYMRMLSLAQEYVAICKKNASKTPREDIETLRYWSGERKEAVKEVKALEATIDGIFKGIPNIPHPDVPVSSGVTFEDFLNKKGLEYVAP